MLEVTLGLVFILVLLTVSLPAEANYQESVRQAAYVPAVRFVVFGAVVAISFYSPPLAFLALLIAFFWLADIHLLSKKYT